MGPGETLVVVTSIVSLFVLMPWIIVRGVTARKRAAGGREMRQSELTAVIGAAVDEATEPLVRRIEALEAIATATDDARAPGRIDPAVLADVLDPLPDDASAPAGARRARS